MLLSVVIITYNEEKNIQRCLESVRTVADEIVIVDSFSTDDTKVICRHYNARFIEHPFEGYGQQKNIALQHASHDHVLSMDADEALDSTMVQSILKAKSDNLSFDGYTMNRCTNYCGGWIRHGTWYPDRKLRLFNRHKIQWSTDPIHETTVIPSGASIQHLPGDILHYSYNSLDEHISQNNKFSTLSAEFYFSKGKKASLVKLLVNPAWAYIQCYLLRLGFLDGFRGYVIAKNVAHLTFMKYYKLYALQKGIPVKAVK
jgi:glycosyltransferase involved in cell wall biosynthesis